MLRSKQIKRGTSFVVAAFMAAAMFVPANFALGAAAVYAADTVTCADITATADQLIKPVTAAASIASPVWSQTGLPNGMYIDQATGVIKGVPYIKDAQATAVQNFTATITAASQDGTLTASTGINVTVNPADLMTWRQSGTPDSPHLAPMLWSANSISSSATTYSNVTSNVDFILDPANGLTAYKYAVLDGWVGPSSTTSGAAAYLDVNGNGCAQVKIEGKIPDSITTDCFGNTIDHSRAVYGCYPIAPYLKWIDNGYTYQSFADYCNSRGITPGAYQNTAWLPNQISLGVAATDSVNGYKYDGYDYYIPGTNPPIPVSDRLRPSTDKLVPVVSSNRTTATGSSNGPHFQDWDFINPASTGAQEYIQGYINYFKSMGYKYVKQDFMRFSYYGYGNAAMSQIERWMREGAGRDFAIEFCNEVGTDVNPAGQGINQFGDVLNASGPGYIMANDGLYADSMRITNDTQGWNRFSGASPGDGTVKQQNWPPFNTQFDAYNFLNYLVSNRDGTYNQAAPILDGDYVKTAGFTDREVESVISLRILNNAGLQIGDNKPTNNGTNSGIQADTASGAGGAVKAWAYKNADMARLNLANFYAKPVHIFAEAAVPNKSVNISTSATNGLNDPLTQAWFGRVGNTNEYILGIFNRTSTENRVTTVDFAKDLGLTGSWNARDLWYGVNPNAGTDAITKAPDDKTLQNLTSYSEAMQAHGCRILSLTPASSNTVTFYYNDGVTPDATVSVTTGSAVAKPADPKRPGYIFAGWIMNDVPYNFSAPVNSDITISATWTAGTGVMHTVTFDSNGGSPVAPVSVEDAYPAAKPANPTQEGYDFVSWNLNGVPYDFSAQVTSDITLVAQWRFTAQNVASVAAIKDTTVEWGTALANIALPATVMITLGDGSTASAGVTWNAGSPAYSSMAAPKTYTFTGALALPDGVVNLDNLTASANVTVKDTSLRTFYCLQNADGSAFLSSGGTLSATTCVLNPTVVTSPTSIIAKNFDNNSCYLQTASAAVGNSASIDFDVPADGQYTVALIYKPNTSGRASLQNFLSFKDGAETAIGPTFSQLTGSIPATGTLLVGASYFMHCTQANVADNKFVQLTLANNMVLAAGTYTLRSQATAAGAIVLAAVVLTPIPTYTVSFDAGGGAPAPEPQTVIENRFAAEPEAPARDGFIFLGWFAPGSDTAFDFANTPIAEDTALTAKWALVTPPDVINMDNVPDGGTLTVDGMNVVQFFSGTQDTKNFWITSTSNSYPGLFHPEFLDARVDWNNGTFWVERDGRYSMKVDFVNGGNTVTKTFTVNAINIPAGAEDRSINAAKDLNGKHIGSCPTSNPSGTYVLSANATGNSAQGNAFDLIAGDSNDTASGVAGNDNYVQVNPVTTGTLWVNQGAYFSWDFTAATPQVINTAVIIPRKGVNGQRALGSGLQGSNDGVNWTTFFKLPGRADNVNFVSNNATGPSGSILYQFDNSTAYRYYRWYGPMTRSGTISGQQDGDYAQISELMLANTPDPVPELPAKYAITYDMNGVPGTAPKEASKISGSVFAAAAAPSGPVGKAFAAWNTSMDGSGKAYAAGSPITVAASAITLFAIWSDVAAYTVSFDANGGSPTPADQKVADGGFAAEPTPPTRDGYIFDGWFIPSSDTAFDFLNNPINEDTALTAQWTPVTPPETFIVSFDAAGGSPIPPAQTVTSGGTATKPANPAKAGYTFDGWFAPDTTTAFDFGTAVNADLTLTAHWTLIPVTTYTVTFDAAGGSPNPPTQTVTSGGTATKPANPAKAGYTFDGWFISGAATAFDFGTAVNADLTLTAHWTLIPVTTYTVTFDAAGGSPIPLTQTVASGGKASPPVAPTKADYTFAGWYLGGALYNFNNPVTANITLVAQWTSILPVTYTVTFNANGGSPAPAPQTVTSGGTAAEPAAPTMSGYTFGGWFLGGTLYNFSAPVTANITLTAQWTPISGPVPPTSITMSAAQTSLNMKVGAKLQLQITVNPVGADPNVTWSSSNPAVATVDPVTGLVTALKTGSVRITVKSNADPTVSYMFLVMINA